MKKLRWHWGFGIAAVYLLFAAATVGFAVFAMEQRVELVSADYYQRALQYDQRMAAEANAAALDGAFRAEPAADGRMIRLIWSAAQPARGGGVVSLYRPSDSTLDRSWPVAPDDRGAQQLSLAGLPAGRWLLQVQWRAGGRDFYVEQAVVAR